MPAGEGRARDGRRNGRVELFRIRGKKNAVVCCCFFTVAKKSCEGRPRYGAMKKEGVEAKTNFPFTE